MIIGTQRVSTTQLDYLERAKQASPSQALELLHCLTTVSNDGEATETPLGIVTPSNIPGLVRAAEP